MRDLVMFRGDDLPLRFAVTEDGRPMSLAGAAVRFTARRRADDPDPAVISKATGSGIVVDDPVAGVVTVSIAAADTATIPPDTRLVYDLQVTRGGLTRTVASGTLTVEPDVSRGP